MKIVVELEERKDADGNTKFDQMNQPILDARVKWINALGGSGFVGVGIEETGAGLASLQATALGAKKLKNFAPGAPKFDDSELVPF